MLKYSIFLMVSCGLTVISCGKSSKGSDTPPVVQQDDSKKVETLKPGKDDETKKDESGETKKDESGETKKDESGETKKDETPPSILGSWSYCKKMEFKFKNGVLSASGGFIFEKDGTFKEFSTLFTDADCKKPFTQAEATAAGYQKDFVESWNEKYSGKFLTHTTSEVSIGNIDMTYDDEGQETLYRSYKINGNTLSLTDVCLESSVCFKLVGDSAENRAVDFQQGRSYQKQ